MRPRATARSLVTRFALAFPLLAVGCAGAASPSLKPTASVRTSGLGRCSTAVAAETPLAGATTSMLKLGGMPFGVAVSQDGHWAFVVLGGQVAVLSEQGTTLARVREISLPGEGSFPGRGAGAAITNDGRYLLVAAGNGAVVIDVRRAEAGSGDPVLGTVTVPPGNNDGRAGFPGGSAIEVTTTPDGKFAFVSLEYADEIAVFNLQVAIADHLRRSGFIGTIGLGRAVVGMAVSPDGKWLYATSEVAAGDGPYGTVSVIDVQRAETSPASAVVATAAAGCGTVRVAASPDGRVVWVTARESDDLLAFSASALRTEPHHALLALVRVGEAPVTHTSTVAATSPLSIPIASTFQAQPPHSIVDADAVLAGRRPCSAPFQPDSSRAKSSSSPTRRHSSSPTSSPANSRRFNSQSFADPRITSGG